MRKRVLISSISLVILALVVGILVSAVLHLMSAVADRPSPTEIRNQVRDIQTLATQEYAYRDVVFFDEETRVLGLRTGSKQILFAIEIRVIAGVDLSGEIDVEFPRRIENAVFITLPPPQVLRVDALEETIDQYFVREGLSGIDWVAVSGEVEAAKERNRTDAIERGILTGAQRQAEDRITELLLASGFERVEVRFRSRGRQELRG